MRARTGVGEYMHELVRAFAATAGDDVAIFTSSWRDRPRATVAAELGARVVDRRVPVHLLNYLWHRLEWPPVEWVAGSCDVVHAAHPLLIPARRAAQVVTIHDLFFLSSPDGTRAEIRRDYPLLTASHAARADAIVTPSHYTKRLVVDLLGVPAERIYVCSPGAPRWASLGRAPNVPADGYLLFFGTLEPRKNLGILLDAYEQLAGDGRTAPRLVVAGGATADAGPWLERLQQTPLRDRVQHIGYVPHHERERLYAGARALVLPSLDEGFGLPVLEAMSAGLPVIVSDRGSLPEVAGTAGTILRADDAAAWASAIARTCAEPEWMLAQGAASLARAATFTWPGAAAQLRRAYVDARTRRRAR